MLAGVRNHAAALALLVALACARRTSPPASDRVGTPFEPAWIERRIGPPASADARATLVRFWTDACPYCRASLPAIDRLRREHAPAGLDTVAVYHPKPPRAVADADVERAARELGYEGALAVDADWELLRRLWLDTGERAATSATFLADADGVVRWVHPGPELFESDVAELERAIEELLTEGR